MILVSFFFQTWGFLPGFWNSQLQDPVMRTRFGLDGKGFSAIERDCTRRGARPWGGGWSRPTFVYLLFKGPPTFMRYQGPKFFRIRSWTIGGLNWCFEILGFGTSTLCREAIQKSKPHAKGLQHCSPYVPWHSIWHFVDHFAQLFA